MKQFNPGDNPFVYPIDNNRIAIFGGHPTYREVTTFNVKTNQVENKRVVLNIGFRIKQHTRLPNGNIISFGDDGYGANKLIIFKLEGS